MILDWVRSFSAAAASSLSHDAIWNKIKNPELSLIIPIQANRSYFEFIQMTYIDLKRHRRYIAINADFSSQVDIFLYNKECNRLLDTTTWTVEEIEEMLPKYFEAIGHIFDCLDM